MKLTILLFTILSYLILLISASPIAQLDTSNSTSLSPPQPLFPMNETTTLNTTDTPATGFDENDPGQACDIRFYQCMIVRTSPSPSLT